LKYIIQIACFFFLNSIHAQWTPCIDSSRISPLYQCNDAYYNPVCGCNGITYRNQCDAYNVHGINTWSSGVCSGLDLDFYPNPIGPNSVFTVNLSFPEFVNANATVRIVDLYGKVWEQRQINNFNRMLVEFNVYTLKTGLYFLVVTSSLNTSIVKKFSKF
jgi:hypothetical protein